MSIDTTNYELAPSCQVHRLADLYKIFLGYKRNGFFVEVGAFDGETVSNTSGLADIGWAGIYIEPVEAYANKCRERHASNFAVKIVNCAVGHNEREIEVNVGGVLSTVLPNMVEKFNSLSWAQGFHCGERQSVMQYPLERLLREHDVPYNFDVLSVDVEGYEWQVLETFPIQQWAPKIVIVELHDTNPDYADEWDSCNKIAQYFLSNRYEIIYKDFTNTVYKYHSVQQISHI